MSRLRPTACLAILAMAWAALLPFTAAARMLAADGPVEYCHKLSIDGATDPDPANSDGPSQPRKVSCPFCASAAVCASSSPPPLPGFVPVGAGARSQTLPVNVPRGVEIVLPPSRAPPSPL